MAILRSVQFPTSRIFRFLSLATIAATVSLAGSIFSLTSSEWKVEGVPIAFWAWRNEAPRQRDVTDAVDKARARTLFLRAGQIDWQDGEIKRIRPVHGHLPTGIELHLVYNATRALLTKLDQADENVLATTIVKAFNQDIERARRERVHIAGLQLDIDMPTRLLGRYKKLLAATRKSLEPGIQLSITGLPAWMESSELKATLKEVNFWIPQFYGSELPERLDQMVPISSTDDITHFVKQARDLDENFYAGLAAYSWSTLYSASGSLISLRGDLDLATIAADSNLELVDQRRFGTTSTNEWRYTFRARTDGVTGGLIMRSGEHLVIDVPNSNSLQAAAKVVRELAGKRLKGICIFRLPSPDDPATLSVEQVGTALNDQEPAPRFNVRITRQRSSPGTWILELANVGTASVQAQTLNIDLQLTPGSIETVRSPSGTSVQTLCTDNDHLAPCSELRASVLRIRIPFLEPGQLTTTSIGLKADPPTTIPAALTLKTNADQTYEFTYQLVTDDGLTP